MNSNSVQYDSLKFAYNTNLPGNIHACKQDVDAIFELAKDMTSEMGITIADIPLKHYQSIGKIAASFTKGLPAKKSGNEVIIPTSAIVSASESTIRGYLQDIINSGQIVSQTNVGLDSQYDMSATEEREILEDSEKDQFCLGSREYVSMQNSLTFRYVADLLETELQSPDEDITMLEDIDKYHRTAELIEMEIERN